MRTPLLRAAALSLAGLALASTGGARADDVVVPDLGRLDGRVTEEAPNLLKTEAAALSAWWEGDYLHVTIASQPIFVASLCIGRGDRVRILHASSALGSVGYARGDGGWSLDGRFDWQVRDTRQSAEAVAERRRYLDAEGWVATTVGMGEPGQTEFIIAARLVPPGTRMTAALMPAGDPESIVGLSDRARGCNTRELVAGPPPERLQFTPERWGEVPARSREN